MDDNTAQKRNPKQVLVVGGGLAGISAACDLADSGFQVRLLEKRPYLGGRTYSFLEKNMGIEIDNGQHIFMKCCEYYIDLLHRLGVYEKASVQQSLRIKVYGDRHSASILGGSRLPAPLHLIPSFLRYTHLSFLDKISLVYGVLALRRIGEKQRTALDGISFYHWLKKHRQTERSIENFWNLVVIPTLNDTAQDVSAAQAIMVFQDGIFKARHTADIGIPTVGLSSFLPEEAKSYIEKRGGTVSLSQNVKRLDGNVKGINHIKTHDGTMYSADYYLLTVPPAKLLELLPTDLAQHAFFDRAGKLGMSPIVNVHLWLDREVTDDEFCCYLGSHLQWMFNKSLISKQRKEGQYLCFSLSAAHQYIDMPKEELIRLITEELHNRIPRSKSATIVHHVIVRERSATFSAKPGSAANRLTSVTPVPNLFLAGAWTDTNWPSTMESAVRSGAFASLAISNLK